MMTADGPAEIGTTVYYYNSYRGCIEPIVVRSTNTETASSVWFRLHCALTPLGAADLGFNRAHSDRGRRQAHAAWARWKRENPE